MKDEDKTYENERNHVNQAIKTVLSPITHARNVASAAIFNKRGPNDLEEQIDMLTKQKEYMQKKCREAGAAILDLESQVNELKRDNSLLAMDVATLTNRLRDAGL
tara:strand:+ start:285 stop:599 length:315 start_codon:yes stop_codon:yes gene_type:complete